jgi:hypothetical protein
MLNKGDFVDFIEKISIDSSSRNAFLDNLYREDETPEALLKFFYGMGFDGVSLEDCVKLLSQTKECPRPDIVEPKY